MPIRYDAVLAGALALELDSALRERRLEELHFVPETGQAHLVLNGGEELVWMLHPSAGHVLLRSRDTPSGARRARARGRGLLTAPLRIEGVTAVPDERRVRVRLGPAGDAGSDVDSGGPSPEVLFELQANRRNALLLADGTIRSVLWPRRAGDRPVVPGAELEDRTAARAWMRTEPDPAAWTAWWRNAGDDPRHRLLREVAWTSRINAEFLLAAGRSETGRAEEARTRLSVLRACAGAADAAGGPVAPAGAWNLVRSGGLQPYPHHLEEPDARPCDSLLAAMKASAEAADLAPATIERPEDSERHALALALEDRARRARNRRRALERQLGSGGDPEEMRTAAQLILMHRSSVRRGDTWLSVTGFDGREREISLDPTVDALANAERLFDEARRRERAVRELPARIAAARAREEEIGHALSELRRSGPSDELWRLAGGRPPAGAAGRRGNPSAGALPYRRLQTGSGLELRVGRSARGNDDLTFRHSSPDDIWLHARQAAGAHVILRWGKPDQNPPEADLRDAAIAAAEFSEARTSGVVAVDWTRRKHVRKPRKSAPGAVTPGRVRTIFVEPDAERVRRMREAGPDG